MKGKDNSVHYYECEIRVENQKPYGLLLQLSINLIVIGKDLIPATLCKQTILFKMNETMFLLVSKKSE
jgi:hypothetical protein